jgi:hypothetical protein
LFLILLYINIFICSVNNMNPEDMEELKELLSQITRIESQIKVIRLLVSYI